MVLVVADGKSCGLRRVSWTSMFKNVRNILDIESVQVCRLCLAEEDLIYIFNPKGYQGFLLWEIIEEFFQMQVSKKDGLPWTICKGCTSKVKEFKHFKMTCIKAKISFLTMIANRGLVETTKAFQNRPNSRTSRKDSVELEVVVKEETPVVSEDEDPLQEVTVMTREEGHGGMIDLKEEVNADESLSDAETSGLEMHLKDISACTGVSNEANLSDPLYLSDVKEDAYPGGTRSGAVTYNQNDLQESDTLGVGFSNVECLLHEMGEPCEDEEEDDPSESLAGEEAQGVEDVAEDESRLTSVSSVISVRPLVGNVVEMRRRKRKACGNAMGKFLQSNALTAITSSGKYRREASFTRLPSGSNFEDVKAACEGRIADPWKQSKASTPTVEEFRSDVREIVGEMLSTELAKIQNSVQSTVKEVLQSQLEELKRSMKNPCNRSLAGSSTTSETRQNNDKVSLGFDYMIESTCFNVMKSTNTKTVWANALLVGVFGEERAKNMALYPRTDGKEKLPITFLTVAKDEFKKFLSRNGRDVETPETEKEIRSLPAYIAARSYDMSGIRAKHYESRKLKADKGSTGMDISQAELDMPGMST